MTRRGAFGAARRLAAATALAVASIACGPAMAAEGLIRPKPRPAQLVVIPETQWDHRGAQGDAWTREALSALKAHGAPLVKATPHDMSDWCPGYARAGDAVRRAFWVGFLSTLAKYESRWRPTAVGGGGQWYGLMQIYPATARHYDCRARSGDALKDGGDNLSCAIRIMAVTVPRDGVIHAEAPRWSGVSADWGPMRNDAKRHEMQTWLRGQDYCQIQVSPRPKARPAPPGAMVEAPALPDLLPADGADAVTGWQAIHTARTDAPLALPGEAAEAPLVVADTMDVLSVAGTAID